MFAYDSGKKRGSGGIPPALSLCRRLFWPEPDLAGGFLRSSGLPSGQDLWKNRARHRVTIDCPKYHERKLKMQTVRDAALGPEPEGVNTSQSGFQTIWRQACDGLDVERLLPSREKRVRDLAKKLDRPLERNGWRMFVSGQAYAMKHGKARQQRNAEVMLVETVARWRNQIQELLPEREKDLRQIVRAGLARPEKLPAQEQSGQ